MSLLKLFNPNQAIPEGISREEFRDAMSNMKEFDDVLLDADTYFAKVAHVLKVNKENTSLKIVLNPYQTVEALDLRVLHKACRINQSIADLTICVGSPGLESFDFNFYAEPEVDWTKEQVRTLAKAFLSLPKLKSLRIDYANVNAEATVPFYELIGGTTALPLGLEKIRVEHYQLQKTAMDRLCKSLRSHPTMKELHLHFRSDHAAPEQSVQPLLELFLTLPQLKVVQVADSPSSYYHPASLTCNPSELRAFLETTKLRSLQLWLEKHSTVAWSEEDLRQVALGLTANTSLQSLKIGTNSDTSTTAEVVPSKQLNAADLDETHHTDEGGSSEFSLHVRALDNDDDDMSFFSVPSSHSVETERSTPQQQLLDVLEYHNRTLQELYLFGMPLPAKLPVYLNLNKAGRALLFRPNATPEDWMRQIVQHKEELDCTLELLRMNPTVLSMTLKTEEEKAADARMSSFTKKDKKKGLLRRLHKMIFCR